MAFDIKSGEVFNSYHINDEGIFLYGTLNTAIVDNYGRLRVESGGVANSTAVVNNASMYIHSGGVANSTVVNSRGYLYIHSGGTANMTTVNEMGSLYIFSGGVVNSISVNSDGYLYVSSGGTALNIVRRTPSDRVYTEYGAIVTFAHDFNGVYFSLNGTPSSAMTINGITLDGEMNIFDGGVANETAVNGEGCIYISSGGVANSTTIFHGEMIVYSGGAASGTVICGDKKNGLDVSSGGAAYDTIVYAHGNIDVEGGLISNTLVTGHEADMELSAGGTAINTTVQDCAELEVSSGALVQSVTAKNNGQIYISHGAKAISATAGDWGVIYVMGGSADEISVDQLGKLHVGRGGTATRIRENGGCVEIVSGANVTFAENSFTGMVISSGMMTIHTGTVANRTTVKAGELAVYDGGIVNSTAVEHGSANFYRGAKATGALTIADGAVVSAYAGSVIDFDVSTVTPGSAARVNDLSLIQGTPDFTITLTADQAAGTYRLADGAAGFDKTVTVVTDSGAELGTLTVGGTLAAEARIYGLALDDGALVLSVADAPAPPAPRGRVVTYREDIPVSAADVMTGKTISGGGEDRMLVLSGGVADRTAVKSGGYVYVSNCGGVNSTIIDSDGNVFICGGAADQTTVTSGGYLCVCSNGTAIRTVVNADGYVLVSSGGEINSTTVNSDGDIHVYNGGTADLTTINPDGNMNVYNAAADRTTVNGGGYMSVRAGGTANRTTVNEDGNMAVYNNGAANRITVNAGGHANISSGGKITGTLNIADGAVVSAYAGSVIDFDVSTVTAGSAARVNDLSLIQGTPDFTITLTADQAAGTYRLADGAAGFDKTVTVSTDAGTVLGTLTVGGELVSGDCTYRLNLASDTLSLTVAGGTPNPGDLNGDGRADIVMTISKSGHPADGSTGAWLIQENQTAAWGDLSTRNAGWSIFGTGFTAADKSSADVYVKSEGNVVGAWVTDNDGKVAGWETVGSFDAATQVLGLGDFNGDGQSDLLLRNVNGAVGCHFTSGDKPGWNYFQSLGDEWKITAVGDLNGDGRDDVVLKHDAGFAGSWLTQSDYTMAWADLDTLQAGFSIVGAGDFDGDGTDDVLLKKGNYYGAWLVQDGHAAGWFGIGDLGNVTVEQIADFNADGVDDLRIRTAAGDLGAQLVRGADSLEWKYYGSVGCEWSTALTAI